MYAEFFVELWSWVARRCVRQSGLVFCCFYRYAAQGVLRRVAPGVAGCARINGEDYVHNSPPLI